ncbi:MAG: hypothetical protein [Microviridae sp.]|nr:MAG: hypothetical protein [Microviridae sp.]
MYKYRKAIDGYINNTKSDEGETIEAKVKRMVYEKEPIKDGAPLIWTDRKDGVNSAYNIRTDRWEIATETMDKLLKSRQAKREDIIKSDELKKGKENAKGESIEGKLQGNNTE